MVIAVLIALKACGTGVLLKPQNIPVPILFSWKWFRTYSHHWTAMPFMRLMIAACLPSTFVAWAAGRVSWMRRNMQHRSSSATMYRHRWNDRSQANPPRAKSNRRSFRPYSRGSVHAKSNRRSFRPYSRGSLQESNNRRRACEIASSTLTALMNT